MHTWLLGLFLCTLLLGPAVAQTPVEIADGRAEDAPGLSDAERSAWTDQKPMREAFAAARAYWRDRDPSYEEDTRVLAVAGGAFTEAGAEQQAVLYLMSLWPRCCPKMGLAVVQDGRLVRNIAFEQVAQDLAAVPDLDGDGFHELVFTGEFGMGGQTSRGITIASFGPRGLVQRGGTSILDTACAAGYAGSSAAHVWALSGPTLTVERYTAADCETMRWEPAGAPETLALDGADGAMYTDLGAQ